MIRDTSYQGTWKNFHILEVVIYVTDIVCSTSVCTSQVTMITYSIIPQFLITEMTRGRFVKLFSIRFCEYHTFFMA